MWQKALKKEADFYVSLFVPFNSNTKRAYAYLSATNALQVQQQQHDKF